MCGEVSWPRGLAAGAVAVGGRGVDGYLLMLIALGGQGLQSPKNYVRTCVASRYKGGSAGEGVVKARSIAEQWMTIGDVYRRSVVV